MRSHHVSFHSLWGGSSNALNLFEDQHHLLYGVVKIFGPKESIVNINLLLLYRSKNPFEHLKSFIPQDRVN